MLRNPINIGVIGVGHLGQHHAKHYSKIPGINLVGVYDIDLKKDVINESNYQIMLGNSSEDIFFNDNFSISYRKK